MTWTRHLPELKVRQRNAVDDEYRLANTALIGTSLRAARERQRRRDRGDRECLLK